MGNSSSKTPKSGGGYNQKRDSIVGGDDIEAFRQKQLELQRKYQEEQAQKAGSSDSGQAGGAKGTEEDL